MILLLIAINSTEKNNFRSEVNEIKTQLNSGYPLKILNKMIENALRPKKVYYGPEKKKIYYGVFYYGRSTDIFVKRLRKAFLKHAPGYCRLIVYYKNLPSLINEFQEDINRKCALQIVFIKFRIRVVVSLLLDKQEGDLKPD